MIDRQEETINDRLMHIKAW